VTITADGRRVAGLVAAALAERIDVTRGFAADLRSLLYA
jgi:hypothetical protein